MTPEQLRRWREKKMKLTQEQAARDLEISYRRYQRYEGGEYPIPKLVELACEALSAKEKP